MTDRDLANVLSPVRWGILFSLAAILFGFGLGGAFGGIEETLKGDLKSRAEAVLDTAYAGDKAKLTATVDKAWIYYQRAHLHGGAIGTASLVVALLLAAMSRSPRWLRGTTSAAMGLGALGYAKYWLFAGYTAVSLGSTGAAKDALEWLAWPSAGMVILGIIATFGMAIYQWLWPAPAASA